MAGLNRSVKYFACNEPDCGEESGLKCSKCLQGYGTHSAHPPKSLGEPNELTHKVQAYAIEIRQIPQIPSGGMRFRPRG